MSGYKRKRLSAVCEGCGDALDGGEAHMVECFETSGEFLCVECWESQLEDERAYDAEDGEREA